MRRILTYFLSLAMILANPCSPAMAKETKSTTQNIVKLDKPIIRRKETKVLNPDKYIAEFQGSIKGKRSAGTISKIAGQSDNQKSAWLLALPGKPPASSRFDPVTGVCIAILVVVVIEIVVGYVMVDGVKEEVKKLKEEQQEILKCFGYD